MVLMPLGEPMGGPYLTTLRKRLIIFDRLYKLPRCNCVKQLSVVLRHLFDPADWQGNKNKG